MAGTVCVVTGGAGFIGSHAVDLLLAEGHPVRVIDDLTGGREANVAHHAGNPKFELRRLDIRDLGPGHPAMADARYVFHFAGIGDIVPSIERPADYMAVNVQGTVATLEAARHAQVEKFVYAASSSCYGLADVPTTEDHPTRPEYPYALSKYLGELTVLHWHRVYKLPANSIRIFNAYGPRSRTSGAYGAVFGTFLKQKLAGAPLTIVGDGTQRRDFVFVTDLARAFYLAATTPLVGRVWNAGSGKPESVNRLAELIGGPTVPLPKRPGEPDCTWADISRITGELGWRPQVPFAEGVAKVLENIEYWRTAPLWTPDTIAQATKAWFDALGTRPG